MRQALIIFLKYPEPGKVKRRLSISIGIEQAAWLYRCFVKTLLANLKPFVNHTFVFYAPAERQAEIREWIGAGYKLIAQEGCGLGKRMSNAFEYVFKSGAEKAVIIGTDIPLLQSEEVLNAFSVLDKKDCVIGPAYDGGYYLLGLNRLHKELFALDKYSNAQVLEKTMEKAQYLGLSTAVIDKHFDVDIRDDLVALARELEKKQFCNNSNYNELRLQINNFLE